MSASIFTNLRPAAARRRGVSTPWAAACTALLMGLACVGAQAQPYDQRRGPGPDMRGPDMRGQDMRDRNMRERDMRDQEMRGPDMRNRDMRGPAERHMQPRPPQMRPHGGPPPWRGAGPDHRWQRGDRLPPSYRTHHYVVNNWRAHHLYAPPRGYQWVQYGGDYLLVAVATGVITQLILSQ